jgi:hypothetical protein
VIPPAPEHTALVERLAGRTVGLVEREYPNSIRLSLDAPPTGLVTPASLSPAFYGCYDWHSAVHSHWQLVRAIRVLPGASFEDGATAAIDRTLTAEHIAVEASRAAGRPSFEMPYGMAWLLTLYHELRSWDDDRARRWAAALSPLERHAVDRFRRYCAVLPVPVRGGMHQQTAFSLGLVWDSTPELRLEIADAALRFYGQDTRSDLRHEPSAADFLSPSLSEADLMRRVLGADRFAGWFDAFAPTGFDLLEPVEVVDPSDGQLAHWAGLNLSRSWMLRSIAAALPADHPVASRLDDGADAHAAAGLATADHDDIMISHWVPTFAVRLLTGP